MQHVFFLVLSLLSSYLQGRQVFAQNFSSAGMQLKTEILTTNQGVVWGFQFLSPDEIIFTTRNGDVKILSLKDKKVTKLSGAPKVVTGGQTGLMDISLHPQFEKNHLVYLTYNCGTSKQLSNCLGKAELKGKTLVGFKKIFETTAVPADGKNTASRLAWGKDSLLFMTVGDYFESRDKAQALDSYLGKMLRLTEEGRPASGNPFLQTKNAKPEIYAYGLRNPEGLFFDKYTGTLWEQEHGPQGGDEINIITAGKNYGWPVITYGIDYNGDKIGEGSSKPGMEQPIHYWVPSIAPSGLVLYKGNQLEGWRGNLFSGALKLTHLNRLELQGGKVTKEERLLESNHDRIRDVREGLDGWLYYSTDSGKIVRIVKR